MIACYSCILHSLLVFLAYHLPNPMVQSHRAKKFPSTDSSHLNGASFGGPGCMSNVKILSKSKDNTQDINVGADLE
ncbi:unnamed protein product [Linum trigynum]|uniref:Uncharacterized protein n=1 Tax=Linum trigynum TaxID=586398 RepID=A0AAV2F180_9ROSI